MILASPQRGFAAGIISAVFVLASVPALAQTQRPTGQQPSRAAPAKPAPAAKPVAPANGAKPASAKAVPEKPVPGKPLPAQANPAAKPAAAPATGPGGAALLASYSDWNVYTAQTGRSRICYALSQPKDRMPKNLKRDPAYLFVSFRPAENVRNEVALVLGFIAKEGGPAEAVIGSAAYSLLTKATDAWLKNAAEEGQAIATMSKSQSVIVKTQSVRGNQLTDRYSLSGFGQALDRARKECS